jgi:hypothetical protein
MNTVSTTGTKKTTGLGAVPPDPSHRTRIAHPVVSQVRSPLLSRYGTRQTPSRAREPAHVKIPSAKEQLQRRFQQVNKQREKTNESSTGASPTVGNLLYCPMQASR